MRLSYSDICCGFRLKRTQNIRLQQQVFEAESRQAGLQAENQFLRSMLSDSDAKRTELQLLVHTQAQVISSFLPPFSPVIDRNSRSCINRNSGSCDLKFNDFSASAVPISNLLARTCLLSCACSHVLALLAEYLRRVSQHILAQGMVQQCQAPGAMYNGLLTKTYDAPIDPAMLSQMEMYGYSGFQRNSHSGLQPNACSGLPPNVPSGLQPNVPSGLQPNAYAGSQPNAYSGSQPQVNSPEMDNLLTNALAKTDTADFDCFEFHETSLVDYAFAQLSDSIDDSSGSFAGSGNGTGALITETLNTSKQPTACTGLTNHLYVRSLEYGIYFEDPQLETAFQEQMTQERRLLMWVLWPGLNVLCTLVDVFISIFSPGTYEYHLSAYQLVGYGGLMLALCLFYRKAIWCDEIQPVHLARCKLFGELWFYIGAARNLAFILNRCYGDGEPAAEDWILLSLTICSRTVIFSWAELSPVGALITTLPLWVALLMVPHISLVFRVRICLFFGFMSILTFMIYHSN